MQPSLLSSSKTFSSPPKYMVNVVCHLLWRLGTLIVFPAYCFLRGRSSPLRGIWRENRNHLRQPLPMDAWYRDALCVRAFQGSWNPGSCLFNVSSFRGDCSFSLLCVGDCLSFISLVLLLGDIQNHFFFLCGTIRFSFESAVFYAQILEL